MELGWGPGGWVGKARKTYNKNVKDIDPGGCKITYMAVNKYCVITQPELIIMSTTLVLKILP